MSMLHDFPGFRAPWTSIQALLSTAESGTIPSMEPEESNESRLSAYLDGELSETEASAFETELADNSELRSRLDELKVTSQMIKDWDAAGKDDQEAPSREFQAFVSSGRAPTVRASSDTGGNNDIPVAPLVGVPAQSPGTASPRLVMGWILAVVGFILAMSLVLSLLLVF